jgi:voltage-gated potassium channel
MLTRRKLYKVLEMHDDDSLISLLVNWLIMGLILLNVLGVVLETVDDYHIEWHAWFLGLEIFSVFIFTLEYLARLWVCTQSSRYGTHWYGRLRYMMTPMAMIDLLAILPFYLQTFIMLDTRILRVFRLLRVFKLSRHFTMLGVLGKILKKEAKTLLAAIFVMLILIVLAATGIYLVEHRHQPEAFGNIPRAMWWAAVTITTVGYGDVVPVTNAGRIMGALITVVGVGMAALPAGIIASGFTGEIARRRERYEIRAKQLLKDGILDEADRRTLIRIREELGIDRSDAQHILRKALLEADNMREASVKCPHCGKPVDSHSGKR